MTFYSVVIPKSNFTWVDMDKTEASFQIETEVIEVEVPDIKSVTIMHYSYYYETRYVVDYYYKGKLHSASVYAKNEALSSYDENERFHYIHDMVYRAIANDVELDDNAWKVWYSHSVKQLGVYAGLSVNSGSYSIDSPSAGTHASAGVNDVYAVGGAVSSKPVPVMPRINGKPITRAADELPCMNQDVLHPPEILSKLSCQYSDGDMIVSRLKDMVIHLNDDHRWSREKIADWIDELHDKGVINAEFQPWEEAQDSSANPLDGWQELGYTTDEGFAPGGESHDD